MSGTQYALLIILVSAAINYVLRAIPFVLFGKRAMPPIMRYLADYLPAAIMAVLVIYCMRSAPSQDLQSNLVLVAGVVSTGLLHLWKGNTIISVFGGTAIYMLLYHLVL